MIVNVVLGALELNFHIQTFQFSNLDSSETVRASIKMHAMTFIEIGIYRQGASVNVVLGDFDLNFQGQSFEMLISRKR